LHLWLDAVFGVHSSLAERVFQTPHPRRNPIPISKKTVRRAEFDAGRGFLSYAVIDQWVGDEVSIVGLVNNSLIQKTVTNLANPRHTEVVFRKTIPMGRQVITSISNGLLLIDSESCNLLFIRPPEAIRLHQAIFPVEFCEDNGLCFSTNGNVFCISHNGDNFDYFGICKISPQVPVCAFSETKYSITAVGVRNGSILLFERRKGEYLRTVATNALCPKRLLVTNALPFVLVQYESSLKLFSLYGELLREKDISFEISAWTPFVSNTGIDLILVADTMGKICLMEAFTLKEIDVARCGASVLALKYSKELQGMVAVTQEGRGIFAELPLVDLAESKWAIPATQTPSPSVLRASRSTPPSTLRPI
jgi:hypothetical protein